jgi:TRAP-type C4-dicarboxylate transport system substrate-binding protein
MKSQKLITMMLLSAASAFSALAPASAQEVKWRMQSNLGTAEPGYESVRVSFVEALEKMSKGRIKSSCIQSVHCSQSKRGWRRSATASSRSP